MKLGFASVGDGGEQVVGEPAADHRADLCQLLGRAQPIEPACQRGMQRGRDVMRHRRDCRDRIAHPVSPASTTALVSSSMNSGTPSVRSRISSTTSRGRTSLPPNRSTSAVLADRLEPVQAQARAPAAVRPRAPRSPAGTSPEAGSAAAAPGSIMRSNSSRLVGSIQCTSSKIARIGRRRDSASTSRLSASSVLCLRCWRRKIEPRISPIDAGQGEQLGNERCVFDRRRSVRQHGLKLVELRRGVILPFEPRGALELGDDRMERAVRVMGRAEVAQVRGAARRQFVRAAP